MPERNKMIVDKPIPAFHTIGKEEISAVEETISGGILSGYLGGIDASGPRVSLLEQAWETACHVKHAIAVNSATSGLLAACVAADVDTNDIWGRPPMVICPTLTMSATAAAPLLLGADIHFLDSEDSFFCVDRGSSMQRTPKAVIITNLFGHPARMKHWRELCDSMNWILIEDNAQAPFAEENNQCSGTIGHIGVWSLNVHKALQSGEGGIVTTNDDSLADKIRKFSNHGELANSGAGLNLRMTEATAAIALVQLQRRNEILSGRIDQAGKLMTTISNAIGSSSGIVLPMTRTGCRHVYYAIAMRVINGERERIVRELNAEGVPVKAGYLPLTRIPAFKHFVSPCPVADRLHDHELMLFENCAYSPTDEQIDQIGQAFRKVMT